MLRLHYEVDRVPFFAARHAAEQLLVGKDAKGRSAASGVERTLTPPLVTALCKPDHFSNDREQVDFFSKSFKDRGWDEFLLHASPAAPEWLALRGSGAALPPRWTESRRRRGRRFVTARPLSGPAGAR